MPETHQGYKMFYFVLLVSKKNVKKNVLGGGCPKLPYDCSKITWKAGYAIGLPQGVVKPPESHG